METFSRAVRKICQYCAQFGALLVFFLMIWGVAGIIGRFAFNTPIPGHYEASSLMLIIIVYLGVANTQFEGGHIRMTLVVDRAKGRKLVVLNGLYLLLCFIVSLVLLWRTGIEAMRSIERGEFSMGIYSFPIWPSRVSIAVGFLLLCVTFLIQIMEYAKSIRKR